ncbi:TetR/AcrR family transcriptional regulator [Sphingomonas sp. G-3-2-10]|uniref:TetR/AcrR family transcriptional regulator n=1 Tax=Sphingomonas sp. G-3-2-10 TaxID=2728838 RepID=UPI00146DB9B2|nr:TetR/AcrR family transcriptional regulator [Sphingomonas sp. G-3-2-10]NML05138.1 TetR family transcriptional regulator [Sphingomonas sp. G-3-2-10]
MAGDEAKKYHHGDLRAALIDAGLGLLAERSADELGLREVARTVGVSATAVYRHFPDKSAFLTALAAEGLRLLGAAQYAASDAAGGGKKGFAATGAAYVRFAIANPALFRLAFSAGPDSAPPCWGQDDWDGRDNDAFRLLRQNAQQVSPDDEAARRVALKAWALVHGLALLILDGQIVLSDAEIDAVVGGM